MLRIQKPPRRVPFQVIRVILLISIVSTSLMLMYQLYARFALIYTAGIDAVNISIPVSTSAKDLSADNLLAPRLQGHQNLPMNWAGAFFITTDHRQENSPVFLTMMLLVGIQLYLFLGSLNKGTFMTENTKRLYTLSGLVIGWAVIAIIRHVLLSNYVHAWNATYKFEGQLPQFLLQFGVIMIIVAWVYREGVTIQEENELTI